jgi:hypothetical protein
MYLFFREGSCYLYGMIDIKRFLWKWIVFVGTGEFFGIACAAGLALGPLLGWTQYFAFRNIADKRHLCI